MPPVNKAEKIRKYGNPSKPKVKDAYCTSGKMRVRFTEPCAVDTMLDAVVESEQNDEAQQKEGVKVRKIAKADASLLLAKLIDAFSEPDFQVKLQEYILQAREAEGMDQTEVIAPFRTTLVRNAQQAVAGEFGLMFGTNMSAFIAPFLAEDYISSQLSVVDELLALTPNYSINYIKLTSADSLNSRAAKSALKKT